MTRNLKTWLTCGLAWAALGPVSSALAEDAQTALCQPSARTAAIIAVVPGFKSYDLDLYIAKRPISEGVVIRKSYIDKGKIIIPPEGLYYTSRLGSIGTMTGPQINAWHFEDNEGNKSVNLAKLSTGGHIDLLANISSSTVGSFATRDAIKRMENEQAAQGLVMKK